MKIDYIKLKAEKIYNFKINNNVTIITDVSGSGKTLLFKFIEFLLGSDGKHIVLTEANKVYPGLDYIEMGIISKQKHYVFRKHFDFKTQLVLCDNVQIQGNYKDILNEVINYNPIKVIKNRTEFEFSTFTLREYVKTLFFNEERLTSQKPLIGDNYSEAVKIKNFYKYLVTGISLDERELKKAKDEHKVVTDIKNSLNLLKKELDQPSPEDKSDYVKLKKQIAYYQKTLTKYENQISDLVVSKNEKNINIERLKSLKQLLESQIEDMLSAKQFEYFLSDFTVKCECGKDIHVIDSLFSDNEYKDVKLKIKDISSQIKNNNKDLKNIIDKINNLQLLINNLQTTIEETNQNLQDLTKKIEDYDVYVRLLNIFNIKNEKRTNIAKIEKEEEFLEKNFINNINEICLKASERVKKWGLNRYTEICFDLKEFEFTYDGTLRYLLSKGYKNICTCAVIIEILNKSISLGINSLRTIVIDSFWTNLFIKGISSESIINLIVKDLENINIQVIIMENTIPSEFSNHTTIYHLSNL